MNPEERRRLLFEFVEANLPLDDAQRREMEALLATEKYAGVRSMRQTHYEMGVDQGGREILYECLKAKFGPLLVSATERLQAMSWSEMKNLGRGLIRAQSLADLGLDK